MKFLKRCFYAALLALLLSGFQSTALANISISSASPTDRQINFVLKEGENKTGAIIVENLDSQSVNVSLYGADGTLSNQGTFALTTKSANQQAIGKWVSFETPNIELKGNEKKEVTFTITIPKDATPGTYGGGIAAETSSTGNGSKNGKSVNVSSRVVVKLFVDIPGAKNTSFEWNDFSYRPANGSKILFFNLSYKNTGNTIINIEQKINIQGFPGITQSINLPAASLPQGSSIDIPARWEKPPFFGFLTATATTTFSEYDIINNKNVDGQTQTKTISIVMINPGVMIIGGIIGGLILLVIAVYLFLFFSNRHLLKISNPYTVQQNDTITGIAEGVGMDWKKLAKLNKLKPPYTLKAGSILKVPPVQKK